MEVGGWYLGLGGEGGGEWGELDGGGGGGGGGGVERGLGLVCGVG